MNYIRKNLLLSIVINVSSKCNLHLFIIKHIENHVMYQEMYKVKMTKYHSPSVQKPNLVFLGRKIHTSTAKYNEQQTYRWLYSNMETEDSTCEGTCEVSQRRLHLSDYGRINRIWQTESEEGVSNGRITLFFKEEGIDIKKNDVFENCSLFLSLNICSTYHMKCKSENKWSLSFWSSKSRRKVQIHKRYTID